MIEVVKTLPPDVNGPARLIELLETLLADAKAGRIIGLVYAADGKGELVWGIVNMNGQAQLAAAARLTHHANKRWDAFAEEGG